MFANRFGSYPPERIVVLTKMVDQAQAFDQTVNYPIHRIPLQEKGPSGFEWTGLVWGLVKVGIPLARQHQVEVIQCARPLPEGIAGYVIAKLLRKKLVINFHGEDIAVLQQYKVERFLMRTAILAAQLNLANSHFTERLIAELGGPKTRTAVVHPGFNPGALRIPDAQTVANLRKKLEGNPIILTVGRLQERKGQDQVIRALPELIKHFPDLKYVLAGSTHGGTAGLSEKLLELAEHLGVGRHVVLAGEVDNEDLSAYYAACDLFVMPNRDKPGEDVEGFGIVFLEAGFFEKPVIGGSSGGVPDAVQHGKTGVLVDGNSVEDIAQAVITILSDKERSRQMGEDGKEFALSLTYEKVFEHYRELMTKLEL